jgi:hypothetical protein
MMSEADVECLQGDMSLEDLQQHLAAEGILLATPRMRFKESTAGIPMAAPQPNQLPTLFDVKQALIADIALPLSCQELHNRCDPGPALVLTQDTAVSFLF